MLLTKAPQGILQDTEAGNFSLLMGEEQEREGEESMRKVLFFIYSITSKRLVSLNQDVL